MEGLKNVCASRYDNPKFEVGESVKLSDEVKRYTRIIRKRKIGSTASITIKPSKMNDYFTINRVVLSVKLGTVYEILLDGCTCLMLESDLQR